MVKSKKIRNTKSNGNCNNNNKNKQQKYSKIKTTVIWTRIQVCMNMFDLKEKRAESKAGFWEESYRYRARLRASTCKVNKKQTVLNEANKRELK